MDSHFWVLVAFIIFVALAWKQGKAAITKILDGRANAVRAELNEAKRLREEAAALLASYAAQKQKAEADAADIIEMAKTDAKAIRAKAAEDAKILVETRQKQLLARISRAEHDAFVSIQNKVGDLVITTATQILAEQAASPAANDLDAQLADQTIGFLNSTAL